ncbi:Dehydrogenase/reductase SDR family member 1 [Fukomys damarensis]|uniref:Dehydrogenase/reductase SDR family member 1 n=1 Tax=Fukomys damarensis TaxID=885580 RepID=A0A091DLW6_FUKDA|nr:Dehydrogenase/reductase SDR family member 1 [Fukomys damarensis]
MAALMKGQVCVVTGASRGISRGIALQLCQTGATVYITGRHEDTLQVAAEARPLPVLSVWGTADGTSWRGLIVVISSLGGLKYMFNVPYGVGKAACDKLAADCAHELRCHGVSYVSLWPGLVQIELLKDFMARNELFKNPLFNQLASGSCGRGTEKNGFPQFLACLSALAHWVQTLSLCTIRLPIISNCVCAADPDILSLSGKVLPSCDLAHCYGLTDVDGRPVYDYLSMRSTLQPVACLGWLASYLPGFLRMPKWIITLCTSKF